jgi:hypothetical protein
MCSNLRGSMLNLHNFTNANEINECVAPKLNDALNTTKYRYSTCNYVNSIRISFDIARCEWAHLN